MRFEDLEGLTNLSIEGVRQEFRDEDVITVLPVSEDVSGSDSLLIATPSKLAVLTGDRGAASGHGMTYWAPWDAVRLADESEPVPVPDEEGTYRLAVHVGDLAFHARMSGPAGHRALADFMVALRARREALALSP